MLTPHSFYLSVVARRGRRENSNQIPSRCKVMYVSKDPPFKLASVRLNSISAYH